MNEVQLAASLLSPLSPIDVRAGFMRPPSCGDFVDFLVTPAHANAASHFAERRHRRGSAQQGIGWGAGRGGK